MADSQKGSNEKLLSEHQRSMMMRAAEEGFSNLVLIAMDINPAADNSKMAAARSAIDEPLVTACLNGHLDVARNLMEKCHAKQIDCHVDVTVYPEGDVCPGVTPLWAAACCGNLDLVKYLVAKGAGVNVTSVTQSSPLRVAACDGHLPVVKFLVEKGAGVNSTNNRGMSVLMAACFKEHHDIVEYLLDHGADVNYSTPGSDFGGETALHDCAKKGNTGLCKLLLARGASITRCQNNETPLLTAAKIGHDELVEFFVGTPDCSRDDKVDALELLGTKHWLKGNPTKCLSLWQRAFEERHRPGKTVIWKREADEKVAAYGNAIEAQTMEELPLHELDVQSMLIRERVLGKTNIDTSNIIQCHAAGYANKEKYDRAIELMFHVLDNLKSVCPFNTQSANVYGQLISLLARGQGVEGPRGVTFFHTLTGLQWAVSDFERGEAAEQQGSISETLLTNRQNLLRIILHMICLLYQTLHRATPKETLEFTELVQSLVKMGYRDQKGNTVLHMACDADTTVFDTRDNSRTCCTFPAPEVVRVLLDTGCDVAALNEAGKTALQVAQEQEGDQSQITSILMAAGS